MARSSSDGASLEGVRVTHPFSFRRWVREGTPWIWFNAGAVALSAMMVVGLLVMIGYQAMSYFWPNTIYQFQLGKDTGENYIVAGEVWDRETHTRAYLIEAGVTVPEGLDSAERVLIKVGNRELTGVDFVWKYDFSVTALAKPPEISRVERREWGDFFGYPLAIKERGFEVNLAQDVKLELNDRLARANQLHREIKKIEKRDIGRINYQLERLRLKERKLELEGALDAAAIAALRAERNALNLSYERLQSSLFALLEDAQRDSIVMRTAGGQEVELALSDVISITYPNALSLGQKIKQYLWAMAQFVVAEPREANTEGGVAPAIFGTVLMVLIMAVLVTPFGVIAAIYLREYAHQGWLTRTIRIGVNNLAGVPSIVYGVFGLGFFVYFVGGGIDDAFYPEAAPAPVFGTPGLLWASFTLALLTVPVVIVATEEGLARIPKSVKEGSLALGATQFETLWKVTIPMASPAMMTGLILAVARAAGEVAPLMLVGVVKLAPALPLDLNMPFLHLERKFMHLGFHIYDVGFQSPNVEAARPLVYATAFLLVLVIGILNLTAIRIRNQLREKYKGLES